MSAGSFGISEGNITEGEKQTHAEKRLRHSCLSAVSGVGREALVLRVRTRLECLEVKEGANVN